MSIFKRVKQFFRAITARVTQEDRAYISTHLNSDEQKLFFAMSIPDQNHSLHVAYTIERLVIDDKKNIDKKFLIRCALLHDIGKVRGDMSIVGKIFTVLVTSLAPSFANKLEKNGNRWIYIYRHHAEIGARKLQKIGLYRESKIIAKHHSPQKNDDPQELKILRLADEEN